MIAILNMEKPKSCKECIDDMFNVVVDCYPDEYGEDRDGNKIICPLISIVTCGECKHYEESEYIEGDMVCKYHIGHTYYTEADRFCSYGERRSE